MDYFNKKVVVVLVVNTLDGLKQKIEGLIAKGYDIFEVTLRTDCALDAIKLIKSEFTNIKVGAGTILTLKHLQSCIKIGADFGVAPGFNKDIVSVAQECGFRFIPGVATPSEIELAMSMGIDFVKIFPARVLGGTDFIKALSGPYHKMKFMPTGGIGEYDYDDYLSLPNVTCVGGSWMSK
jgi:2-dehydro-3-deoxyphosphogluconate aldolase/(4S)-4-hydroxy-2-oxoglutarate aldolase